MAGKCGQNDHMNQERTAERIAAEHGSTEKTVRSAADYAKNLETVADVAGKKFK